MEQTYRIWIRKSDNTMNRTIRSEYGQLTQQKAVATCNKLNAHTRKNYPDLAEAGQEFFYLPEGELPKMDTMKRTRPQTKRSSGLYLVYNSTGHPIPGGPFDKDQAFSMVEGENDLTLWEVA